MEIMSICWYKDQNLAIYFSDIPKISLRFLMPSCNDDGIYEKPFKLDNFIDIWLVDYCNEKEYFFSISSGYTWDGASIPRFFWRLIGTKTDPRFLIPSMIHDVLCENHDYVDNDRYFSTLVFERLLYVSQVPSFLRWLMKHSVDNWQKFCRW